MNRKTIAINFVKLKAGGGQNVALNFLHGLKSLGNLRFNLIFFVARDSQAHIFLKECGEYQYFVFPRNPILCILYEIIFSFGALRKHGVNVIYTYFGYSLFLFSKVPQVSGSADSNLFFPEVDFWSGEKILRRCAKWLVDKYRIYGLKHSIAVVFENNRMLERSKEIYGLENVYFIKPSIVGLGDNKTPPKLSTDSVKLLFLCGWQRNKGILIIPQLVKVAKDRGVNVQVTLTAGNSINSISSEFIRQSKTLGVTSNIDIVEPVLKSELPTLYSKVDLICLLSKLESFSNNIIEAWHYRTPLIIADEPWAHSICEQAAVYVNREDPLDIIHNIEMLIHDRTFIENVTMMGTSMLSTYPTIEERILEELAYVEQFAL